MRVLLDTHIVLRWLNGDLLPRRIVTQVEKAEGVLVSMVTPWELAIKASRHPNLRLITGNQLASGMEQMGARLLHIQREHIERLATLPDHHHDPFDRMIIAQAIEDKLSCISSDERFPLYKSCGLQLLWK